MPALRSDRIDPRQHFFRRLLGRQAAAVGAVQLIGGQVAQIFQQGGALLRQADKMQVLGAFHGRKLFLCPHGAVFGHPRGALGVPHLHGGKVIARAAALHGKVLRIGAFAAGCAADNQRQHCGVYGAMPPSAKE